MAQWTNTFNGSAGGSYRLTLNVDLLGQDTNRNVSAVRVNAWVTKLAGSGYYSSAGSGGNINVNGNVMGRSFGNYDFRRQGTYYFAQNEDYEIGHDANGNANPYFGASYDLQNTPGSSSTGGNYGLPQIPRYANITYFNFPVVTDERIAFNWGSDNDVDYVSWWSNTLDGGGHHDTPAGGRGPFNVDLKGLTSNKQFDFTVAVRRADSQLWSNSGTAYPTTLPQSNFFDGGGL